MHISLLPLDLIRDTNIAYLLEFQNDSTSAGCQIRNDAYVVFKFRIIAVFGLFKLRKHSGVAHALYSAILIQARLPVFYTNFGVQDTVDGRFDMIVLHAHILFNCLKEGAAEDQDISQAVFDLMFADMDQNLRELGVGDTGVSIRVKAMAEAFYGRATAYADGLREDDDTILIAALKRNLYRNSKANDEQIEGIAKYVRYQVANLNSQNLAELNRGTVSFISVNHFEEGDP